MRPLSVVPRLNATGNYDSLRAPARSNSCNRRTRRGAYAPTEGALPLPEPWVTKRALATHLGVSDRWIELQQRVGLPYLRMGAINRYSISEVEAWLRSHYGVPVDGPDAA